MKDVKLILLLLICVMALNVVSTTYFLFRISGNSTARTNIEPGCFLAEPFSCGSYSITPEGIVMQIKNGGEEKISLKKWEVQGCGAMQINKELSGNSGTSVFVECSGALKEGEILTGIVSIEYLKSGEEKSATGEIAGIVERI